MLWDGKERNVSKRKRDEGQSIYFCVECHTKVNSMRNLRLNTALALSYTNYVKVELNC